jgi:hypothetical protein
VRHYAYACCKDDREYALVVGAATAEGLSVSNFVRRCINAYLIELSEDGPLLEEQDGQRGRPRTRRRPAFSRGIAAARLRHSR